MTSDRVYRPDERPDVQVLVDGVWRLGELRMWRKDDDGSWVGQVQYRPDEPTRRIATFPAEAIRLAQTPKRREKPPTISGPWAAENQA